MDGSGQPSGGVIMAIQRRTITMHRGLTTSFDDVDAPLGAVKIARNVRYFAHRRSFSLALGRQFASSFIPGPVGGTQTSRPVASMNGVSWDPGSGLIPHQMMYKDPGTAGYQLFEVTVRPGLPTTSRALGVPIGLEAGTEFELAAFENEFFVATGKTPLQLRRGDPDIAPNELLNRWGMDEVVPGEVGAEDALTPVITFTVGTIDLPDQSFWYWWTWVFEDEGKFTEIIIEGTHNGWDLDLTLPTPLAAEDQGVVPGNRINFFAEVRVREQAFLDAIPAGATHVRVYRGVGLEIDILDTSEQNNPWPVGSLVGTRAIVTILAEGPTDFLAFDRKNNKRILQPLLNLFTDIGDLPNDEVGTIFDFIRIRQDNISAQIGMNGPAPRCSAIEVFEESIIANDLDDPRKTRFSFPGRPHVFPGVYFINHESKEQDVVIAYRVLKNVLGVFLRYGVDRVNWLPRQGDGDFNRGRVKEIVTRQRGLTSRRGITKFQHPMFGEMIAYMSDDGMYITDLRKINFWTSHLNWKKHISNPEVTVLVDDPDNWRLVLAHQSPGDETMKRLTYFYYDPAHLTEDGRPAIVGPVDREGGILALVLARRADGVRQVMSSDTKGSVLFEDFGFEDQATEDTEDGVPTPLVMQLRTQDIYPAGLLDKVAITRFGFRGSGIAQYTGTMLLPKKGVDQYKAVDMVLDFLEDPLPTKKIVTLPERVAFEVTGEGGTAEISHLAVLGDDDAGEIHR